MPIQLSRSRNKFNRHLGSAGILQPTTLQNHNFPAEFTFI